MAEIKWSDVAKHNSRVTLKANELRPALNKMFKALDINVKQGNKLAAFTFHKKVTEKSPVDTGRLRANNQLDIRRNKNEIDVPKTEKQNFDNPPPYGINTDPPIPRLGELSEIFWFFNNLDYFSAIDMGTSDQAPQGMVGISLIEMLKETQRYTKENNLR